MVTSQGHPYEQILAGCVRVFWIQATLLCQMKVSYIITHVSRMTH